MALKYIPNLLSSSELDKIGDGSCVCLRIESLADFRLAGGCERTTVLGGFTKVALDFSGVLTFPQNTRAPFELGSRSESEEEMELDGLLAAMLIKCAR